MFLIKSSSNLLRSTTSSNGGSTFVRYLSTASTSTNTTRQQPSVYDVLRRKRDRSGLVNVDAVDNPDVETIVYPRERQGLNYDLNWTLNAYNITPHHQAYRNARLPVLMQNAKGTKTGSNVLNVSRKASGAVSIVHIDEAAAKHNGASTLSIPQYKALLDHVKEYIGDQSEIYVHDAAIGSDRASETLVRAVTTDAVSSLYLKHMLPATNVVEASEFKHTVTLYLVPDLVLTNPASFGLQSGAFNVLDVKRGIAVIGGVQSTENVKSVLSAIYEAALARAQPESIALNADIYVSAKAQDKPLLVLGGELKSSAAGKVVAQGALWTPSGVARLYNAVSSTSTDAAKNAYDLVEKFTGGKVSATSPVDAAVNSYASPASVVFLIKDTSAVIPSLSSLSSEQAQKFLVTGFSGNNQFKPFFSGDQITTSTKSKSEIFKKLIEQNNTNVYIINTNSLKDGDVDQLLTSIASGKVNKPTKSDIYTVLSPIGKQSEIKKESVKEFESNLQSHFDKLLF